LKLVVQTLMLPDRRTVPIQIASADVQYVEQNRRRGTKIGIAVAAVGALLVAALTLGRLGRED
jgi:hypothetical protein